MTEDIRMENLIVHFPVKKGCVKAVNNISATFKAGEITGIIGESGCGKSVLGMAILGLLPSYARLSGSIWFEDQDLLRLTSRQMRKVRGRKIGLIPQNPGDSLNAVRKVKEQLLEAIRLNGPETKAPIRHLHTLLTDFGFPVKQTKQIAASYPFQLSGGMQQRVVAAMGIASGAGWILADEPSKGLDNRLRNQMYENLLQVKKNGVHGMIIITHDLVLADTICDNIAVMYSGEIIEMGKQILLNPAHPYTAGLLRSLPSNGMNPMEGSAPAPDEILNGCRFSPRCPYQTPRCFAETPGEYKYMGNMVRCFLYG